MRAQAITAAALLGSIPAGATLLPRGNLALRTEPHGNSTGIPPCEALIEADLGDRILFPSDPEYEPQVESWWAENARLRPYCIVLPHNTDEVSKVLRTLVDVNPGAGDWHIAVRSGGHSLTGNNIEYGVTIDLSMMNGTSYDPETNLASLQPGGRWRDTYGDLDDLGVVVAGGRDGGVGVGGFLLGGGYSFFSGTMGWGCDSIVNYEVVLADGSIVNANSTANADLWQALKGGSSNFGIVTRFDMQALPTRDLFYETRFLSGNYSDAIVDTVVGFADHDQSLATDALVTYFSHDTSLMPDIHALAIHVNTEGDDDTATAFSHVRDLPALDNSTSRQTMAEAAAGSQIEGGDKYVRSTVTFRNDPRIVQYCVQIHKEYVETLKDFIPADNFTTLMFLQPIPSYLPSVTRQFGGNMLGLDDMQSNAVMWTIGLAVDSDDAAFAKAKLETSKMSDQIKEFSRSLQGDMDFIFLNYADAIQDSLGSYGSVNAEHMRAVAAKYDPTSVFQTRIPGGFKISRVGN